MVKDTASLAADMHVSNARGRLFVSVRAADPEAYVQMDLGTIALSPVKVPWTSGTVINGGIRFERDPAAEEWAAEVASPARPHGYQIAKGEKCVAITRDQPELALTAAYLYAPEGSDPLRVWWERLRTYREGAGQGVPSQLSLIALAGGEILCRGDLISEVGLGAAGDTLPSRVVVVESAEAGSSGFRTARREWESKVWIPTGESENRWHLDSFVVKEASGPTSVRHT
ncbi:MAG: hypothetical protein LBD70_03625 [Bifidobacteriaceae bacterium]|nr:hypothetical protein [Bifidobacteriaceae bacterium]